MKKIALFIIPFFIFACSKEKEKTNGELIIGKWKCKDLYYKVNKEYIFTSNTFEIRESNYEDVIRYSLDDKGNKDSTIVNLISFVTKGNYTIDAGKITCNIDINNTQWITKINNAKIDTNKFSYCPETMKFINSEKLDFNLYYKSKNSNAIWLVDETIKHMIAQYNYKWEDFSYFTKN